MLNEPAAAFTDRSFNLLAGLCVAALGILAYANTFSSEFVWDDASSILLHQHVKDPSKIAQLFAEDQHAFAGGQGNFYRPLLAVTFMADYIVATTGQERANPAAVPEDLSPFVFHLTSTLWHVAAALLLLGLMTRFGAPRTVRLVVPILYVVHPLHTEAVAYISGRADSMSAAFIFAGLYCFASGERPSRRYIGIALGSLCFVAGLLSKESTLIFPVLVALTIVLDPAGAAATGQRSAIERWLPLVASLAVLGVYAALRMTVLNFGSDSTPPDSTFLARIVETLKAFTAYLGLIVVPVGLHMERTLDGVPGYAAVFGLGALATCIALAVVAARNHEARAAFAFAWFLVTWLPISGLFPLNAPLAEHWMYVPLAGLLWGLAEFVYARVRRLPDGPGYAAARLGVAAVVVIWGTTLLALTVQRNHDWRDNESLYVATLRESPESVRVHFNLAVTYDDLLDNPVGARRHYEAVVRAYDQRKEDNPELEGQFWRDELEAHLSLGDLFVDDSRFQEAFDHYAAVLSAEQNDGNLPLIGSAAFGLGRCFLAIGDRQRAQEQFGQALRILPQLRAQVEALLTDG